MPPRKETIARRKVLSFGEEDEGEQKEQGPAVEPRHQTTVRLSDHQLDWLDGMCHQIRRGGWRGVTRVAFLRAMVDALRDVELDVTGVSSEEELVETLRRSLLNGR